MTGLVMFSFVYGGIIAGIYLIILKTVTNKQTFRAYRYFKRLFPIFALAHVISSAIGIYSAPRIFKQYTTLESSVDYGSLFWGSITLMLGTLLLMMVLIIWLGVSILQNDVENSK